MPLFDPPLPPAPPPDISEVGPPAPPEGEGTDFNFENADTSTVPQQPSDSGIRSVVPYWNNFYIMTLDLMDENETLPNPVADGNRIQGLVGNNFVIPFFSMPDQITDSKNANYDDIHFVMGSAPFKAYQNSSPRTIGFTIDFFVNIEQGKSSFSPEDLKKVIDNSRALLYPNYETTAQIQPPTRCLVRLGEQASMIGICKSVNVTYSGDRPWTLGTKALAHSAAVSYIFEEIISIPQSYKEIQADSLPVGKGDSSPVDVNPTSTKHKQAIAKATDSPTAQALYAGSSASAEAALAVPFTPATKADLAADLPSDGDPLFSKMGPDPNKPLTDPTHASVSANWNDGIYNIFVPPPKGK